MVMAPFKLREDYWDTFTLQQDDIEFLYNHLLETETPLTSQEMLEVLVKERIQKEKLDIERQRVSGGDSYMPKERYKVSQMLVFPALVWKRGKVVAVRPGNNPDLGEFEVIQVAFDDGDTREYASGIQNHRLNEPVKIVDDDTALDAEYVLNNFQETMTEALEEGLHANEDFVRIAGRWFPRALLVDINIGHLNLAEAVLDMAGGGPLSTQALLEQIEIPSNVNPKLLEFSMDLALQEDERFDEVGATGLVLWFLRRLEPEPVLEPPIYLRYAGLDYNRSLLTNDMFSLERELDDELSPLETRHQHLEEAQIRLIYPHWRAGTLPLSPRLSQLFPTAYEAPRIRFTLVDGQTGERIPAWVVRPKRYVFGLSEWYRKHNLVPGSIIHVHRSKAPGEVIIQVEIHRPTREWVRTVLIGSDGGVVFAMLKQTIHSNFDERMVIAIPDVEAVDQVWAQLNKERLALEKVIVNTVRELAKLNPQGHVHASELYATLNVVRRCPPGPMMALLASRPWFTHVGDLHFRFNDTERN